MHFDSYWYWWIAGLILLALEAFAPGAFFLWMGVSALVVGALDWIGLGLSVFWQTILFVTLSIGSVLAWRQFRSRAPTPVESRLNERARLYENRVFTLESPIVNGIGVLRVDDGQWRVAGPDLAAGMRVRVRAVEGATLRVESSD